MTRRPRYVPDPLTGAPLPCDPPTPAAAAAEQAALDVPVGRPDPAVSAAGIVGARRAWDAARRWYDDGGRA